MWNELISMENLLLAYKKASKNRRSRQEIANFEFELEKNLFQIRDKLADGSYQHGSYMSFTIHDPKKRLISAAKIKDRIVHHALVAVIEPLYEKFFVPNTYANRLGMGTHKALNACACALKQYPYYLFMDVKQFFPSIDHLILKNELSKVIKCEKTLGLCAQILRSGEEVLRNEYEMEWFAGDDLLAINRARGLPIGNMTSQFWANVYLNSLDQFLVKEMRCNDMVRYVDDIVVFSDSKKELHNIRRSVIFFLNKMRLKIHEGSAQPTPVNQGITFLGFRLFPGFKRLKRTKVMSGTKKLSLAKRELELGINTQTRFNGQVLGWLNHVRFGDTWKLRQRVLEDLDINAF